MASIKRFRIIERFVYVNLSIYTVVWLAYCTSILLFVMNRMSLQLFIEIDRYSALFQGIFYLNFIVTFCYQIEKVNNQLAKFFKIVKIKSYPNRVITVVLWTFLILSVNVSIQRILRGFKV